MNWWLIGQIIDELIWFLKEISDKISRFHFIIHLDSFLYIIICNLVLNLRASLRYPAVDRDCREEAHCGPA